ncbi:MAG: histone deacetylase [Elusimicrobiales bacterium]|nr:histone deacetylase [Elusimicrobiales bacterium]
MKRLVASKKYGITLENHVFVPSKFVRAAQLLEERGLIGPENVFEPQMPSRADLHLAHSPEWTEKLLGCALTPEDIRQAEIPVTRETVDAHLLACGGTALACCFALEDGVGLHSGGGGHHATHNHGGGFCLANDIAVAINKMRAEGRIKRAAVVDLDAHQGNGTAYIFAGDPDVFTFSMHGRDIYPDIKAKSSLDVELEPGVAGPRYMDELRRRLPGVLDGHGPELVVYVSGADTYEHDQLGGFKLTVEDLKERDAWVAAECARRGVPVAVVLGGGYARNSDDTARIHANTLEIASKAFARM